MKRFSWALLVPVVLGLAGCFDTTGPDERQEREKPSDDPKTGIVATTVAAEIPFFG